MELMSTARVLRAPVVFASQNFSRLKSGAFGAALALLLTVTVAVPEAHATPLAVGAIRGFGGVSATGAATYAIPINLPPGTHGMQPSLALAYNSQGGDGWVGYGWSLSGFSAITRCSKNQEDDGSTIPVLNATTDNYCLDGQLLRVITGTSGTNGATYGTQIEGFARITSYADGSATGGPSWFKVETKDGRVYEYGNTSGSKIYAEATYSGGSGAVRTWALNQITDASGNYMTFHYNGSANPGREFWPAYIDYTANGATAADHRVDFDFTARPAGSVTTSYVHGSLSRNNMLLRAIKVTYLPDSSITFTYNLTYDQDPVNGRNRLISVQECGTDGSCLPSTAITWKDSHAGWNGDTSTSVSVSDLSYAQAAHLMDVDGDGIQDLVYPNTAADSSINWMVMFGLSGGGFGSQVDTGLSAAPTFYDIADTLAMDYNGDGLPDLMQPYSSGSGAGGVQVLRSTGNRTPGVGGIFITPPDNIPAVLNTNNSVTGEPIYKGNVWVVDFSGGSLSDIMYTDGTSVKWMENTGPSNNDVFANPSTVYTSSGLTRFAGKTFRDAGVDFSGSGRAGALAYANGGVWVALKADNGANTLSQMATVAGSSATAAPFDSNGDGVTDLLSVDANNHWQISLSTGTGFNTFASTDSYTSVIEAVVADYYGNGTQVALVYNAGSWDILDTSYSASTGAFSLVKTAGVPAPYPITNYVAGSLHIGNIESNGLDDLVYGIKDAGGTTFTWHYATHVGATAAYPDQVSKITDGLGNYCQFQYDSLAEGSPTYTKGGGGTYPINPIQTTMQVVSSYTESDGLGGSYSLTYTYSDARVDTDGRGFLGFASRTITDGRTGNHETITSSQTFPFTGMVTQDMLKKGNNDLIREIDNTGADQLAYGSGHATRYLPFFDSSITHDYDTLGGTVQETRRTTATLSAADFDAYGNLTGSTTTVMDKTQSGDPQYVTTVAASYATASGNYCVGLPASVTLTRTVPAGSLGATYPNPASRVVTYSPDTAHCRSSSQTVASGQSSDGSIPLTAAYQFDGYGNVTETDVSATGLATRVSQASFANQNGEFPVSGTSVVSGTVSLTSQATWRYDLGLQSSSTDPNGNVSTVAYDGFGRAIQVTRPDGSSTTWTYSWCTAVGTYCPAGAQFEVATSRVSGGTTIVTGYTAYDMRGRPIEQGTVLLGGVISRVATAYDAFGTALSVSKPFLGSTPSFSTKYTYSQYLHRLTKVEAPQDANDTCSPACSDVTTLTYDGFTTTSSHTVSNSASSSSTQVTQQTRDALGQMLSTVDPNNGTTTYNYDAFGDLVATQDAASHVTLISYDGLGHKTGMLDPNMGTWAYQSDALGELLCQTDAKDQSIIMAYDGVGRVISKLETAAGAGCGASTGTSSTWTYDTQTDGLGLPASVSDSNGFQRSYAYDTLGRPSDVTTTIDSTPYTVSTTYDSFGRIQTVSYPESVTPAAGGSAPTAVATITAGPVNTGTSITLDGSGSTDPNSLGLQYQWTQTGGPTLTLGAFDQTAAVTSFTPVIGGTYSFQLQVIDSGSALSTPASVSVTVKPLPPDAAPTVSENPSVDGNITLTWHHVDNVDSYDVYKSTDNVNFTLIQNVADTGSGNQSTPVTGLGNGTKYFAIGSKVNGISGDRTASTSMSVTLPPSPPSGMTVTPAYQEPSTNYTVSWTAPGSGIVTKYELLEDTNSSFSSPTTITVTAPTHSKVRSKSTEATYYYKVRACNGNAAGACSGYSGPDHVVVLAIPLAPTMHVPNPSTISPGGSSTLSWTKHSGDTVTHYNEQVWLSPSFPAGDGTDIGNVTSLVVSPNVTKYYRVKACNGTGCGPWSTAYSVTVDQGSGLMAPSGGTTDAPSDATTAAPGDSTAALDVPETQPLDAVDPMPELATAELTPVPSPPRAEQETSLVALAGTRQALIAPQPMQPSETALQVRFARAAGIPQILAFDPRGGRGTLNRPAGQPRYAPPVYTAYAGASHETVGGTPFRFVVQYNYDPASGGLMAVSNADTGFIYWRAAMSSGVAPVDAFGHVIGYVDGNNVSTVSAYDQATGAVVGISTGIGLSSAVQQLAYTWDGFGNLKQRCDANHGLTEDFTYDGLNRLATSQVKTGGSSGTCSASTTGAALSLAYDAMGNIQTRGNTGTGGLGLNDTYTYGDSSHPYAVTQVTSTGSYAYDANGNMTSGNGRTITWNDDNLPTSITSSGTVNGNNTVTGSSTFSYAPDLGRYKQVTTDSVAGNSTTLYVGGLFEKVTTSSSTQYRHDIVAVGGVVAVHTLDQAGVATTAYIHSDHLGSSDTITGDAGTVIQQSSFDAFGLRRNPTTWAYDLTGTQISLLKAYTDKGFTDQEQLDSVGLVHMNGRVYDPSIGRMISADPTIPDPMYSQAFNRYSYVYNSSLRYVDPSGFIPDDDISVYNYSHPGQPFYNSDLSNAALNGVSVGLVVSSFMVGIGEALGPEAAAAATQNSLSEATGGVAFLQGLGIGVSMTGATATLVFELLNANQPTVLSAFNNAELADLLYLAIAKGDKLAAARIAAEMAKRALDAKKNQQNNKNNDKTDGKNDNDPPASSNPPQTGSKTRNPGSDLGSQINHICGIKDCKGDMDLACYAQGSGAWYCYPPTGTGLYSNGGFGNSIGINITTDVGIQSNSGGLFNGASSTGFLNIPTLDNR